MDNSKTLITKVIAERTPEERKAIWEEIRKERIAIWKRLYYQVPDDPLQQYTRKAELRLLCKSELVTGICPRCGGKWKEVIVDNIFGYTRYFEPDCACYPKCPKCHKHLYQEFIIGKLAVPDSSDWKCPCGWYLIKDTKKRHGSEYEQTGFKADYSRELNEKVYKKAKAGGI